MLVPAQLYIPSGLIRADIQSASTIYPIAAFERAYPLGYDNTDYTVDRSSKLWNGVSPLPYSTNTSIRGVGATSYSTNKVDDRRQQVCTVSLAVHTSSAWVSGDTSNVWPYKASIVANDAKALVQNYGALVKPYCADPQTPLAINYHTGTSSHDVTEAIIISFSPSAFGQGLIPSAADGDAGNNRQSKFLGLYANRDSNFSDPLFASCQSNVSVDKSISVLGAFSNLQPVLARKHEIYALRLTGTTSANPIVCGLIDCTAGVAIICPIVRFEGTNYAIASSFTETSAVAFPLQGSQLGTTFFSFQTGTVMFSSFNQAMQYSTENKIAAAIGHDISYINISASVPNAHIDYFASLPAGQYLVNATYRASGTVSRISASSSNVAQANTVAACSHIGLFSSEGVMIGYASFDTPQTLQYDYSRSAIAANFSASSSPSVILRLDLTQSIR